jgi:hypothetical protein
VPLLPEEAPGGRVVNLWVRGSDCQGPNSPPARGGVPQRGGGGSLPEEGGSNLAPESAANIKPN